MPDIMPPAERRFYWELFDEIVKLVEDMDDSNDCVVEGLAKAGRYLAGRDVVEPVAEFMRDNPASQ